MKTTVKVAIIQPKPYPQFDDPRNVGHALLLLERCRRKNLDVICFPEYFPWNGEEEIAAQAKALKTYIIAGIVEASGDNLYNTATLFGRDGRILGRQRKKYVGALERHSFGITPGKGPYEIFYTDFGKIGMPVCIDFWGQPQAGQQLTDKGADIIFNIGIFPILRGHWKTACLVRAFENFMPVVGVNTADFNCLIGSRRYHQYGGHSMIIEPPRLLDKDHFRRWLKSLDNIEDWVKVELDETEQIYFGDVDLNSGKRFRRDFWQRFGFQR